MKLVELDMDMEVPLRTLADREHSSENYAWCGYDMEAKVGFFAHLGRWSHDREMWREQLYVYLPDRTVLAYRGFGGGKGCDTGRGPAAAVQRHTCLEPGKRWRLQHRGPVWHLDARQLVQGQMKEPFVERIEFDVEFDGTQAAFMYPQSDNTTWGQWHYEQVGAMSGTVIFGGATHRIRGFAFRDHTRGPRNLSHFCGSNWMQGQLPDGTGFAVFQTWDKKDGRIDIGLSEVTLTTANSVEVGRLVETPAFDSMNDLAAPVRLSFDYSGGRVDMVGEPQNTMIFSASARHEVVLGAARGVAPLVAAEQPMLLRAGGKTSVGHCERCRLLTDTTPALKFG